VLRNDRFVLRPRGSGTGFFEQVFTMCAEAGFTPHMAQEASEATTTLGLVAAGVGITIAPEALRSIRVHDVVWRELTDTDARSRILMVHSKATSNPLREQFIAGFPVINEKKK
jgi:DNA-binding transcriptional LysR family regulator